MILNRKLTLLVKNRSTIKRIAEHPKRPEIPFLQDLEESSLRKQCNRDTPLFGHHQHFDFPQKSRRSTEDLLKSSARKPQNPETHLF
jgi:hypothetical protein